MVTAHSSAIDPMVESHEDRIQRLEDSVTSIVAQVSEQGVELKHVSEKIDSNQEQLLSKFGEITSVLNLRLEHGDRLFEGIQRTVSKQQADINELRSKEKIREKGRIWRKSIYRRIVLTIVVGVAGILAHKAGLALWLLLK